MGVGEPGNSLFLDPGSCSLGQVYQPPCWATQDKSLWMPSTPSLSGPCLLKFLLEVYGGFILTRRERRRLWFFQGIGSKPLALCAPISALPPCGGVYVHKNGESCAQHALLKPGTMLCCPQNHTLSILLQQGGPQGRWP